MKLLRHFQKSSDSRPWDSLAVSHCSSRDVQKVKERDKGVSRPKNTDANDIDKLDWFVDLLFLVNIIALALSSFYDGQYKYVSLCSLCVFVCIFRYKSKRKELKISRFTEIFPLLVHSFGLYILLNCGWSIDRKLTFHMFVFYEMNAVLFTFFYVYYRDSNNAFKRTLRVSLWSGFLILIFIVCFVGISGIQDLADTQTRLNVTGEDGEQFNANALAFRLLVTLLILLLSFLEKGFRVYHVLLVPLIYFLFLTGSRKGFIGLFLIFFVAFIISLFKTSNIKKLLWIFMVAATFFVMMGQLLTTQSARVVLDRVEGNTGESRGSFDTREKMKQLGVEIFLKYPLVGCGIDCPKYFCEKELGHFCYLHSNPYELLAGGGIVAFALYYIRLCLIGIMCCVILWKRNRNFPTQTIIFCVSFLGVELLYEMGSVTYYDVGLLYDFLPLCLVYGEYREQRRC